MEKREKFLPIGSVVLLSGGTKKAMITGFCSISDDDKTKIYDYCGCIYPEGYLTSNQICLFNHDQIEEIFYIGYEDEEEKEFKESLKEVLEEYQNGELDLSSNEIEDMEDDEDLEENTNIFFQDNEDLEHL